jgi:Chaperone of endosialidase
MSQIVPVLSYANNFGDWIVQTNSLAQQNNDLVANNYHKNSGTLYLDTTSLALQSNGSVIFQSSVQIIGLGGSLQIGQSSVNGTPQGINNLTVYGQSFFSYSNIGPSITVASSANINGPLLLNSPNTGLLVSNTANLYGQLNVVGNANFGNTVTISGVTNISNNVIITGVTRITNNTVIDTNTITNKLYANLNISTVTLNASGTGYLDVVQANTLVNTVTLSVTGTSYTNILQANSTVNTSTLSVTGTAFANVLQANSSVNTAILTVTSNANISSIIVTGTTTLSGKANTVNDLGVGNNLYVTGTTTLSGKANTVNDLGVGGNQYVTGSSTLVGKANTVNDLGVGGNQYVTGSSTLVGKANTVNDLGVGGTLYTSKITLPAGGYLNGDSGVGGATITANTLSVGAGGLSVQGNFSINGSTVYNTPLFTISAVTPNPTYAYFGVYRTINGLPSGQSANANIRWNESSNYWDLTANTSLPSGGYYRILTNQYLSDSGNLTNSLNVASSLALANANTFLQNTINVANTFLQNTINVANTNLKSYVDGQIAANVSYISGVDATQNTNINYLLGALNQTNTNIVTANTNLKSYVDYTYSNASNITVGTLSSARLPVSGAISGTYGSSSQVPVISVDSTGRITSVANTAVAGVSSYSYNPSNSTFTLSTSAGTVYNAAINQVTDFTITGNLVVNGSTTTVNTSTVTTKDSLIKLADGNSSDSLDIGFYGQYNSTGVKFGGLLRQAGGNFYLLQGLTTEPSGNTASFTSANRATLNANITGGTVSGLSSVVAIADGGTNASSFTSGQLTYFSGTSLASLAAQSYSSTGLATTNTVTSVTLDSYGRLTNVTSTPITAQAGYLIGSTLSANVTSSSLTTVGTITSGTWSASFGAVSGANLTNLTAGNLTGTIPSAVLANSTHYIGTTSIALNRSSATQTLTGVSIDGNAGTATTATTANALNTSNNYQVNSLGVGTGASGTAGEIRATNNITAYYSDERLKNKLGNIESALDKLMTLNGFYYEANETAQSLGYAVKKEVGVSAQEVQKVLPEIVVPAPIDEKYLTVHYERLVPLLIEAIKELKQEIDDMKK